MPNIQDAFPSAFIKANDLQGRTVIVTIDHVTFEPVGREKEMKAVLYFKGKEKGLVLNKTNANKIMQLTSSPVTEEWSGFQIALYPTETQFGGETVDCVRVKAVPAKANGRAVDPTPPPPAEDDFSDWNQVWITKKRSWSWQRILADLDRDYQQAADMILRLKPEDYRQRGVTPWKPAAINRPENPTKKDTDSVETLVTFHWRHSNQHIKQIEKWRHTTIDT